MRYNVSVSILNYQGVNMEKRKKISIIGSGQTGKTTALLIAENELADIVLLDLPSKENHVKGIALDMSEATPIMRSDVRITGTSDYYDTKDSDIVIITAGITRKRGMSRDDLVLINGNIVKDVTKAIVKYSPDSIIIVLSNPVDIMTYLAYQTSGFPKYRVFGQAGVLDTARFRNFIAQELNISVKDVTGFVLGGHGDKMVPLIRYSYAGGIPLEKLISKQRLEEIVDRTRKAGGEIVQLLENGSAYYAPSAALVEMIEAILKDQHRILPTISYLEGEYGYQDIYVGVPTIIGENGIEKVIELELNELEKEAFKQSVSAIYQVLHNYQEL